MKIIFGLKKLHSASAVRGIGVYSRELIAALHNLYPKDQVIPTTHHIDEVSGDIVHYPYFDTFTPSLTLSSNKKVVLTIHDLIPLKFPEQFPAGVRGKLAWFWQRRAARKVDHIITDSECSKRDIIDFIGVPASCVSVITLGPNQGEKVPRNMAKKIAKSYTLPEKYLLYVGDINWNKNVTGLINAFAEIKDPDLYLLLVGKVFADKPNIIEYRSIEQAIKNSGKADKIKCLGFVPSHHLPVIYESAMLYVQPSWYEGFGLPVLEAMKFGTPVASSNLGSLPEIGGDAVAYFDPAKTMAQVIEKLLKNPEKRQTLRQAGLIRAKEFTWENTAKRTHKIYENLLAVRT